VLYGHCPFGDISEEKRQYKSAKKNGTVSCRCLESGPGWIFFE